MLRKSKVKAIGEFIDQRKYFPNNIIISFEEEPRFTFAPGHQNFAFQSGTLTLPNKYGSAWIIDGQHRLYGFANSKKGSSDPIPVIAFRNLVVSEQAKLFIEINKNQTNVDSNLLWDLYGDIYSGTEDDSQREELTISNVVKLLGTMKGSPFLNHIFIPSQGRKNKQRNLTMSTLCQGIKRNRLISVDMLGRGKQGKEQTKFEEFAAKRIAAFFGVVEKLYPEDWKRGEKGYLRTNNGISAFLIIFRRILRHLNSHEKFIYAKVDISEFEDEVYLLLLPAIEYLRLTKDRPVEFRRRSGQSGQQESAEELINQIKKEYPDYFLVPVIDSGIQGKLPTEKIEDTLSLDDIIKDTELRLRGFVLANLRLIHEDAWFRKGIPGGVKKQINSYMEDEIRKHPYRESELRNNLDHRLEFSSLGQLKDIIIYAENWSYFEGIFKAQNNVEIYFTDFKDLRNAYRGHMRHVDPVLMNRGRAAITWIQRCVEMAGY
jgi:DGQHR domain-containing protein